MEVVDNQAMIALSATIGGIRHVLEQKGLVTEAEVDTAIRGIIHASPMDADTKRKILFLALGPGADLEVVQH